MEWKTEKCSDRKFQSGDKISERPIFCFWSRPTVWVCTKVDEDDLKIQIDIFVVIYNMDKILIFECRSILLYSFSRALATA